MQMKGETIKMNAETTILYRPVGPKELDLIRASGHRTFPPRLPEQPIFYPVLNQEYARQIARDWNVKASGSGYVTRFAVRKEFAGRYPVKTVGSLVHQELWIPAEDLAEMNRNIVGLIEVVEEYRAAQTTRWVLKQKNILDEPADALVCSANVNLMLSGGVGADLLARYGAAMQQALEARLQTRSPHCAQRGEVISYSGPEMPYKVVLHAVAIDGWYESSPEIITEVVRRALKMAAAYEAKKVALTVLATGFGRLTLAEFAKGLRPLLGEQFITIEEVVLCLLQDFQVTELARHLPKVEAVQSAINPNFK
jgi:O-acetyl-ADP-ribose deacetylase (regulator of RNase III)